MGEKLKCLCSSLEDARYKYNVCDICGIIYLIEHNPSCPRCGRITTRELQPGDMEREVIH